VTSRQLVEQCLIRIAMYEDRLNAVITVNPRALDDAEALDRERAQRVCAGRCTASPSRSRTTSTRPTCRRPAARWRSRFVPPYEATLTKNLADAGAIIIAKTVLTELANWVATGMPGNYNGLKGYGMNPYDPRRDPREARRRPARARHGGSSSGIGTARASGRERRHRDVRVDLEPVESEHARGHQADGRAA
jgi:amidase